MKIRCGLCLLSCSEELFAIYFIFIQYSSLQTVDGEKGGFVLVFVCALFSLDHLYLHLKIEHYSLRAFAATLLSIKNNIPVSLGLLLVLKGSLFTSQNYHTIIVGAGLQGLYKEAGLTEKAGVQSRQIQISLLSHKVSWWSDLLACHALILSPWFTLFKQKLRLSVFSSRHWFLY